MRRKHILFIILAVCMLTGCQNTLKAGTRQLEEGNYEEAADSFREAAKENENAAEAYRGLGMALYEQEEYKGALDAFENAVDSGARETPQMYNLMGISSMKTEDFAGALEYFAAGIALADARSDEETIDGGLLQEMRYNEIVCCEKSADWDTAKEKMEQYLADYPNDEEAKREAEFLSTR